MDKNSLTYKLVGPRSFGKDCNDLSERRQNSRYDLLASVDFKWEDANGNNRRGAGFIRDVSLGGLFVMSVRPPPVGAAIEFEICIKSSLASSPHLIQAKGQVRRVEVGDQSGMASGFAASAKLKIRHRL
jgi:hypothetical protein